ncbi:hypothetical protein ACWGH8_34540 [Nonomuraea muscovyensis]
MVIGDHVEELFALIADEGGDDVAEHFAEQPNRFGGDVGTRAVAIVPDTVQAVGRYADPWSAREVVAMTVDTHDADEVRRLGLPRLAESAPCPA